MDYVEISNKIMSGEKLCNMPLKVCFYARVSTESDKQLNSLENQLNYYKNYIKTNNNWSYVDGYVDEGKSGVRVEKREAFKKMIRDAKLHKFDLIITKEVSRFARDLEDSIHYIRELKNSGVGIFFENQNLNTFDTNSELILNIMFNLAQDESRKLSSRVKFGHREAIKKGHVLGSSNITGYKKDNCKLVIVESEAKFVRKVFELYATGNYGFYKLAKALGELGFYNKRFNLYDKDTLKRIISNPKYKGYYRGNVYETIDYRTKKRKKISKDEQIIYKCTDSSIPAIVSEKLWDMANEILKSRTKNYSNNNFFSGGLKYPLSSKMYCKDHNTNYQRSHGGRNKKRPTWSCSMYLQHNLCACISPIIAESDLLHILGKIFNDILPNRKKIISNLLEIYKNIDLFDDYDSKLQYIDNKISFIEEKKSKALDLIFNGIVSEKEIKKQFDDYKKELNTLLVQKDEILNNKNLFNSFDRNIDRISEAIDNELSEEGLSDFIRKFVYEIIVSKIDDNRYNINLDIYLNLLGEEKIKSRGSEYINGFDCSDYKVYLKNQKTDTIDKKRNCDKRNRFIYNVYIKST